LQPNAVSGPQLQAVERLRAVVPALQVEFDPIIGAPKSVSAMDELLSGIPGQNQAVSRASLIAFAPDTNALTKAFLSEQRDLFGHGAEVLDSARLVRDYVTEHNSLRTTLWQQQADGIRVF